MKKIVALLLAAMLIMMTGAALAVEKTRVVFDDQMSFDVLCPEGYEMESFVAEGKLVIALSVKDSGEDAADYLVYAITIARSDSDEYTAIERLNDLAADAKTELMEGLKEDWNDAVTEIVETGLGTEVILLNENGAVYDSAELFSVYHGYFVDMYITYTDGRELTQADIDTGLQILTDLDFIEK